MSKTAREVIAHVIANTDLWYGNDVSEADLFRLARHNIDYIIASLDAAGFVIVPKEPTVEMVKSGGSVIDAQTGQAVFDEDGLARECYKAMIRST